MVLLQQVFRFAIFQTGTASSAVLIALSVFINHTYLHQLHNPLVIRPRGVYATVAGYGPQVDPLQSKIGKEFEVR